MRKNKILAAIALSVSLATFSGVSTAALDMRNYDNSIEYSQYRDKESAYALRASDIIGADLENAKGDGVGEIDDLIVTRKDDKLMAVISVGGLLGIGDRLITVPYEDLRIGKEAGDVYWDIDKAAVEKMPAFKYDDGEPSGYETMTSRRQIRAGDLEVSKEADEETGYEKSVEYAKFRNEDSNYKLRISELLGEDIENAAGDNIGEVDDLILSRDSNDLQAIVSVGGFLGIDDRLVAIPYHELRVGTNSDELYLAETEASLKNKPAFTYNEGESTGTMVLSERRRYLSDAAANTTRFRDSVAYTDVRSTESPYHLRMSEIIGEAVKNANDDEIGEIDDLVMSREDDTLMAIISVGGFLGIGDKLVAVPYKELRVSKDGDDVYIDSTKELLESRSAFKYNEGEFFGKDTLEKRMKTKE